MSNKRTCVQIAVTHKALSNGILLAKKLNADVYCHREYDIAASSYFQNAEGAKTPINVTVMSKRLSEYVATLFEEYEGLVFIMATGIVVRCIAPYIKSKTVDPAIVVMDEDFKFAISLLSGHLGGANNLVQMISEVTTAIPVITTATDINNVTAFDLIAKNNNCSIENIEILKKISSSLLNGEKVYLYCPYEVENLPENVLLDSFETVTTRKNCVAISNMFFEEESQILKLRPKNLFLGVGFKKGTSNEILIKYFNEFIKENHISALSFKGIATIDIKSEDEQIKLFAEKLKLDLQFYNSDELNKYEELFSYSDFVKSVTGTPSVCEPAAYVASNFGRCIVKKTLYKGVTFAVCEEIPRHYEF